ncbi:pyruvate dehydrogenase E2 component (dihydrolipoamide acetyltransferase) [Tistlia consotensis]|uniref:Dihydrolipoamide acetyltransferase component of pyruvate dehydrogenase complex n=1 Tax=Tistlia consotensis USBA 355 TaxID=560819 RepID=A0A1Y6C6X3_9PROT|nr:dihydrolipoamide acetyltransferase family protein [Tistlia consotensis]SMF48475.1 pyruvate dehydrogenase E2 component (dihydrolipoamide acetyltransferase) [Tistlia consotensis USBA 355]SNR81173.1 pyruvate dehydrogenase E2 component (dihydrolipoamide acetyltransferase) [Tistlia consotensis]
MSTFRLPDLGEGLTEAELVAWHVGPGDHVAADQPLVSVETEKAVVEIPSPQAGTVARLLAEVGQRVAVGAPLLAFAEGPVPAAGVLVGTLDEAPAQAVPPPAAAAGSAVKATPAVRRLARERGVDLAALRPSGAHGEVTRDDVLAALSGSAAADTAAWQPLRGARRTMAEVMARAGASVVPATVMDEVEVTPWPADAPVTLRLVAALAAACRAEPALNAWFEADPPRRLLHPGLDLGLAVDTPDGLLVPVVRGAESRPPEALGAEIERVVGLARSRKAGPELYRAPTLTLSNFGSLGGRHAVLVVVPPQVAILGAGRIFGRDGARFLPLSLTFDHRAATGGEAARFLGALSAALREAGQ